MVFRPAVLAAALALTLSACGGGSDETTAGDEAPAATTAGTTGAAGTTGTSADTVNSTTPKLSADQKKNAKLDWVVAANAICADNHKKVSALGSKIQSQAGAEQATDPTALTVKVLEESAPLERKLVADLRAIQVPGEVQSAWTAFVDGLGSAIDLFPQLVKSVQSGKQDSALTQKLAKIEGATRPFAEKYALTECIQQG